MPVAGFENSTGMTDGDQIDAWKQRLKSIRSRLSRPETLSGDERYDLWVQVSEIERLIEQLQGSSSERH
jgi:hypothetical protein